MSRRRAAAQLGGKQVEQLDAAGNVIEIMSGVDGSDGAPPLPLLMEDGTGGRAAHSPQHIQFNMAGACDEDVLATLTATAAPDAEACADDIKINPKLAARQSKPKRASRSAPVVAATPEADDLDVMVPAAVAAFEPEQAAAPADAGITFDDLDDSLDVDMQERMANAELFGAGLDDDDDDDEDEMLAVLSHTARTAPGSEKLRLELEAALGDVHYGQGKKK